MSRITQLDLQGLIALQHQATSIAVRRKHVRAAMSGAHVSKLRGRGMEFDEVRLYQPGDDVGSIDWKVTARKDKPHIKLFREERERPVLIALDYRKAMFFATQGALKSVVATKIAALLAWHGMQQGDRLGGLWFADEEHVEMKPMRGRKGVLSFLHRCTQAKAWQDNQHQPAADTLSLQQMTKRLRHVAKHGSLIYIMSDFRGLNEQAVSDIAQLARHNDVVLVSVLDSLEKSFPSSGMYPMFDGSQYFKVNANAKLQAKIQAAYQAHHQQLEDLHKKYGVFHFEVETHEDISQVVRERLWSR
ncbi:MAG: DUF58 domain-containing protein [Ghiorsea sp.]